MPKPKNEENQRNKEEEKEKKEDYYHAIGLMQLMKMLGKSSIEFAILNFKMDKKWSAIELSGFLESISKIYNIIYAIKLRDDLINENIKKDNGLIMLINRYHKLKLIKGENVEFRDFFINYDENKSLVSEYTLIHPEFKELFQTPSAFEILENIENYSTFDDMLRIKSINYNSPGDINLIGIGDIIRAIHEVYKDIKNKNKNDYEAKLKIFNDKFDIVEKTLKLEREFPEHPLVIELVKEVNKLFNIENKGKLEFVEPKSLGMQL